MTYSTTTRALVALILVSSLAGCGGSGQTAADGNSTTAASPTAPIALKTMGKTDALQVTVTDVSTPKQIGPAGVGPKAEKGETFVVVGYTIKNTSTKPLTLMERPSLTLVDPAGQGYTEDAMGTPMAAGMMADASGMAADLNPNVSAKTKAAWKVDAAAFDRATWRLVVAADPQLTFALK